MLLIEDIMRLLWKLFGKKRKQCKCCFKTFYKSDKGYAYNILFEVCPFCGGDFIVV